MRIFHCLATKLFAGGRISCLALCALLLLTACDAVPSEDSETEIHLSAPTTVSVSFVDVNTLEISWGAVFASSEYKVYMDDNAEASSIDYLASLGDGETSFIKTGLQASTQYWFWVKACSSSSDADCSGYSQPVMGDTTPDEIAPSDFSATAGAGGFTFAWTAIEGYAYNLLRAENDCINSLQDLIDANVLCTELEISTSVNSGLVDSDISADLVYYYWLEAVDRANKRSYARSNPISMTDAAFAAGEIIFSKFFVDGLGLAPALNEASSRLYVASGNYLYALDTTLGNEQWEAPFDAGGAITTSPVLDAENNIYIAATTNSGNIIYKINSSGELQWSSSGDNFVSTAGVLDSLALIENDSISSLYFANSSGSIFRSTSLSGGFMAKIHTMAGSVVGAAAINWYGSVFLGDESNNLVIMADNGTESTSSIGESLVTAPALDSSQNVYFASGRQIYSYTSSGVERWQSAVNANSISSSPILDAGGNSLFQADDDTLYKLSSSDGSEIWSYQFSNNVYDTTPVVDADGNVYVGLSREGQVVVITADGQLASTYSTGKSAGVNSPLKLSSDARLYFSAGDWLFATQAEAKISEESPWPQYKGNSRNTAFIGDSLGVDNDDFYARAELDNENLIFLEDDNGRSWIRDESDFTVGDHSMRSPAIDHTEASCIRAIANNNGFLSFFWKVSSERNFDYLKLTIIRAGTGQEVKVKNITGDVDWQQETGIAVTSGEEINWCYEKDQTVSEGFDAGWLDGVQIQ